MVKLHKEQAEVESNNEGQNTVDNPPSEGLLSPIKPQQLNFGSTSGSLLPQPQTPTLVPSVIPLPPPPPLLPQTLQPLSMANPILINPIIPPPPLNPGAPNPNTRITNVVHIPYFLGRPGADPDTHVVKFELACRANNIVDRILEVFAASLQEEAFAWYLRQPPFADWNALKTAFLDHFRPLGFANSLKEKLRTIRMGINERVDNYYGRMQDILQRMGAHQIPDNFLMSIFIGGLYPIELKTYVKEGGTTTYAQAYGRAKIWEECRLEDDLVVYTDNTYSNNPIPTQLGTFPVTTQNQPYITDAHPFSTFAAPVYSNPSKTTSSSRDPTIAKHEDAIMNLTKQLTELSVKVMKGAPKSPQATNERTNVWCTKCKGHGHVANECPTPQGIRIRCTYCGGNHSVNECWNLRPQRHVNQVEDNRNRPWQEERSGPGPNSNYNPRRNFNKRPISIDFPNRPSWGKTNGPPNWNGPPYNPNARNYNSNSNDKRKIPVCYRCQELGHYANECPNPRKSQDYVPLCGKCKTAGHPTDECPNPKNDYPSNDKDWKKGKHVRIQEEKEDGGSRNVNHIQHTIHPFTSCPESKINAVTTRSKGRIEPLPVPDDNSDDKSLAYESQTILEPNDTTILDPSIHPNSSWNNVPAPVAPTETVVQPIPVMTPIPTSQTVKTPYFVKQTELPTVSLTPRHRTTKFPIPKVFTPGNMYKKNMSRRTRVMELANGLQHYDIINDLDHIKPQITMRQLLAIAPHCRSRLSSSMVRKKPKNVEIHDVTLSKDPGAPVVDVIIDGVLIPGFQVDTGSSVNLMSVETFNELGITKMNPTPIILKMADHTRT